MYRVSYITYHSLFGQQVVVPFSLLSTTDEQDANHWLHVYKNTRPDLEWVLRKC